jgi:SAM-dependent methyltransferase
MGLMTSLQEEYARNAPIQPPPLCRYLGVGCGTGTLENRLASQKFDVTGIDKNRDMISTAKRRMKQGTSSIRFFEMPALEMRRFLKAGSFQVIASLGNLISYIADPVLQRKFIHDCKELLAPGGALVIQTVNYDALPLQGCIPLPDRGSIRVTLRRSLEPADNDLMALSARLELGNGRNLCLQRGTLMLPQRAAAIEAIAQEAGFTTCERMGGFKEEDWGADSPTSIFVFR